MYKRDRPDMDTILIAEFLSEVPEKHVSLVEDLETPRIVSPYEIESNVAEQDWNVPEAI